MNTAEETMIPTYRQMVAGGFEPSREGPEWLEDLRARAWELFRQKGFPTRKEEAWKYNNLQELLDSAWAPSQVRTVLDNRPQSLAAWFAPEAHSAVIACDGFQKRPATISNKTSPYVTSLGQALREGLESLKVLQDEGLTEANAFRLINTFSFQDGVFIHLPRGLALEEPIEIFILDNLEGKEGVVSYPRIVLLAEEASRARILFHYTGCNSERYFLNAAVDLWLAKEARVDLLEIHRPGKVAYHFLDTRCRLESSAELEVTLFETGGRIIRNQIEVHLEGKEAAVCFRGLSLLEGESQAFNHFWVHHNASNTTSRQLFKNILAGRSQAEFDSLADVRRDTAGCDANQLTRNLILSDEARVYSRPWLRINTDEVKAVHGVAAGEFEGDMLFYLQSRGLDENLARYLMSFSFAKEILEAVKIEAIRKKLEEFTGQKVRELLEKQNPPLGDKAKGK